MSRIFVLLEQKENRRLLSEWLAGRYDVISPRDYRSPVEQILREERFDLGIVDGLALEQHGSSIQERRATEGAVFLPFLFVTPRPDLTLATRHLWKTVDDLILSPIDRLELHARVEVLLRARRISVEAEQRYYALAANSPVGVAIVQDSQIAYGNEVLIHLLETNGSKLTSLNFLDRIHPEDRMGVEGFSGAWTGGGNPLPIEARLLVPSGIRWVELRVASLTYRGAPARLYLVSDISVRKQAEEELVRAKIEAEELARMKSSLLNNMSHEVRTPLTSIIGYAEIVEEATKEEIPAFAHAIRINGQRLLETLNSVLDLSQLEGGDFRLVPQQFDLVEQVRETVMLFRPQVTARNLQIEFAPPERHLLVRTDKAALNRILSNLISNAVKFTEEGGIAVVLRPLDEYVEISVADTGVGISEGFLPHIFDEFKQESVGLGRKFEGSGLGLAITKRLVKLLGGDIRVESRKGAGSRFIVKVPRGRIEGGTASTGLHPLASSILESLDRTRRRSASL